MEAGPAAEDVAGQDPEEAGGFGVAAGVGSELAGASESKSEESALDVERLFPRWAQLQHAAIVGDRSTLRALVKQGVDPNWLSPEVRARRRTAAIRWR